MNPSLEAVLRRLDSLQVSVEVGLPLQDQDLDSLQMVEVLVAIQDVYGIIDDPNFDEALRSSLLQISERLASQLTASTEGD
jgi:acyl carrier protein